jgi:ribosome-associated toxin RatA of RatAB toxin-antitoxin module
VGRYNNGHDLAGDLLMRLFLRSLFALCALLFAASAHAGPPALSAGQIKVMTGGKAIVKTLKPTGGDGVAARATAIIEGTPSKVFGVINACEHFSKFMPRTKLSFVVKVESPTQKICFTEIEMPFPFSNLAAKVRSTSAEFPGGGYGRKWTMLEGNYKRNNGSWEVWPYNGGTQSLVIYNIDVDPDMVLPDAIIRSAQTGSLPKVFKAIEKRVKAL